MPYSHAEWKPKWFTATLKIFWIKCTTNTLKRDLTPNVLYHRKIFWTPRSLLFNRVVLAVLNWGLIQQASEKCSARVPFLACQLRSHHKGATNCQMEMIHLFLDRCLIYSVSVQNKPAPFFLPPSCAWKVRWKWNTVMDFVSSYERMRLFPDPSKPQLSLLNFLHSHMGNPAGLKCLLAWTINLPFTNMSISCLNLVSYIEFSLNNCLSHESICG